MAKKRVGCMLAYPFEEKRLAGYSKPYIVQPKLDGNRCRVVIADGKASLLSSTEELITGVPHISDVFDHVAKEYPDLELELDGELYWHGVDQGVINGIVSRMYIDNLHEDYEQVKFHVFDVVSDKMQVQRLGDVFTWCKNLGGSGVIRYVNFEAVNSYDEVIELFNKYVDDGYEGIIVRDPLSLYKRTRSTQMMKFKEKKKDWYKIVDVEEATTNDGNNLGLGMVGAFVCEDTMGCTFRIGAGQLKHKYRKFYWVMREALPGYWCKVGYQNLTAKNKVPRSGLCIEVSVTKENEEEEKA